MLLGNSVAVQWLGLRTFTSMAWVRSLVGEQRFYKPCGTANKYPLPMEIRSKTILMAFQALYVKLQIFPWSFAFPAIFQPPWYHCCRSYDFHLDISLLLFCGDSGQMPIWDF